MVPDLRQYILNISYCLIQAHESKLIYNDITNQLINLRKRNRTLYSSFTYRVGSLNVDGRAYANRNLRDWCGNMHKICDSFLQMINIAYGLENDINKVKYGNTIKKVTDSRLIALWEELTNLLDIEIDIDNFSKHRLNVGISEKLTPVAFERMNYFIKHKDDDIIFVSDLIDDDKEETIYHCVVELLDCIINEAKKRDYPHRAYVIIDFDPEKPFSNCEGLVDGIIISMVSTIDVCYESEQQLDGTYTCKNVSMSVIADPVDTLFLATLYELPLGNGTTLVKIANFDVGRIEVLQNNTRIGYYQSERINDSGVHFCKYRFSKV